MMGSLVRLQLIFMDTDDKIIQDALQKNGGDFDVTFEYLQSRGYKVDPSSLEAMKPKPKNEATPLSMTNSQGMLRLQKEFPEMDKMILNATLKTFDYNANEASKYLQKHGHKMHTDKMDRKGDPTWSLSYYKTNPLSITQKGKVQPKPAPQPVAADKSAQPIVPARNGAPPPVPSRRPSQALAQNIVPPQSTKARTNGPEVVLVSDVAHSHKVVCVSGQNAPVTQNHTLPVDPFASFLDPEMDCPRGCGVRIKASTAEAHDSVCFSNLVECSGCYLKCEWMGRPSEKSAHESSCKYLLAKEIIEPMLAEMQMLRMMIQAQQNSRANSDEESDLS